MEFVEVEVEVDRLAGALLLLLTPLVVRVVTLLEYEVSPPLGWYGVVELWGVSWAAYVGALEYG